MSPKSQSNKKQNVMMEQGLGRRNLHNMRIQRFTISDEQHTQICDVMDIVNQVAADDLHIF